MIFNMTPHAVNIVNEEGKVTKTFESVGVARATQKNVVVGTPEGVTIVESTFGKPVGLLEPSEGVFYIVSLITAKAADLSGRTTEDLLLTSGTVRDDNDQIIGCQALARYK
jgi:hypothetical protein